ncbi:LOW QUALITY PROTEIN: C1GALT1-specific chaperone 1 [Lepeophtheirus salmonis]|uniref:LOW QUALITY PROTEIN: C1GALT1-specific chaperone 1 n=1 Tax=Lepeophtheirus salmonis TaxID=72036 RepID=UPI001AEA52CB|nr:LOW QUALITY PROTEIN: C1GALT1-specific chaperone 1-like [Lepeophtheirus salmonis]
MVKRLFFNFLLSFILGVCIQLFIQLVLNGATPLYRKNEIAPSSEVFDHGYSYDQWLYQNYGYESFLVDPDILHYDKTFKGNIESDFLRKKIPILCLILADTFEGSKSINDTWGSHCNEIRFYSSKINNSSLPIIKLSVQSSFDLYCQAIRRATKDTWIFIAKERTFAVIENLRYYLASKNASSHYYLGHARKFWNVNYNWKDAGIVLSPGSIDKFTTTFTSDKKCESGGRYWGNGDWYLGKNLRSLNITPIDTRDHLGKGRFNGFPMHRMIFPDGISLLDNYWQDSLYSSPIGPNCCSNHAITFHGLISNGKLHQNYYFFYKLRSFPAGGKIGNVPPTRQISS